MAVENMKQGFKKIALITGATRGLGLAVAQLLSEKNYQLILTGRTKDSLDAVKKIFCECPYHSFFSGDLLNTAVLDNLCQSITTPDLIIHALGGKIHGDMQPLSPGILGQSMALNLEVAVKINSYFLPMMQSRKSGRIIHVSSDASETGDAAPGYAAAKAAINAYVKSTARFYAKDAIMICAVLPGIFLHPGSAWDQKKQNEPKRYQEKLSTFPLGRFLQVKEIASTIVNIALDASLAYAGSLIKLTGGC